MAYLKLDGEVGVDITMYGVVASIQDLRNKETITELNIDMTSFGGCSETGRDLYAYFKSLEFPVNTNAVEYVCSAMFTAYLAGQKRTAQNQDTEFLMHSPKFAPSFFDAMFGLSEQELDYLKTSVAEEKNEMAKIYSEVLGIDKNTIITLMDKDEMITSVTAKSLGIIQEIKETITESVEPFNYKVAAKFYANSKEKEILTKNEEMKTEEIEGKLTGLEKITASLQKGLDKLLGKIKALTINTDEGETLEITGDVLEVGVDVTSHTEGTFTVDYNDKKWTVVVVDSKVDSLTEIEPVENPDEDMEALKVENESLKTQIAELTASKTGLDAKVVELEAVEAKVVGLEAKFAGLESITSNYKKEDGTHDFSSRVEKPAEVSTNDEIQAHIQAKKDAKKEKKSKK